MLVKIEQATSPHWSFERCVGFRCLSCLWNSLRECESHALFAKSGCQSRINILEGGHNALPSVVCLKLLASSLIEAPQALWPYVKFSPSPFSTGRSTVTPTRIILTPFDSAVDIQGTAQLWNAKCLALHLTCPIISFFKNMNYVIKVNYGFFQRWKALQMKNKDKAMQGTSWSYNFNHFHLVQPWMFPVFHWPVIKPSDWPGRWQALPRLKFQDENGFKSMNRPWITDLLVELADELISLMILNNEM